MKLPISVIILTYNEEKNIEYCLKSVCDWVEEIFIVDSYSTDRTLEIARKYTDKIYQHPFENYSRQRNWAFENLPISNEWIFNVDADERVSLELVEELSSGILSKISLDINGLLIKKKTIFMGRWIKHGGHYPVYHLRIFRKGKGRCEERNYDQHFICEGKTVKLKGDIVEENKASLTEWTDRHNRWSTSEVIEMVEGAQGKNQVMEKLFGTPIERRRWLKNRIFIKLPLFFRVFLYFLYRYFFKLGLLDGKEGLIFHILQGFWFRFLVDAKIYEIEKKPRKKISR